MKACAYSTKAGGHGLAVDPTIPTATQRINTGAPSDYSQVMSIIPMTGQELFDLSVELLNLSHRVLMEEAQAKAGHFPSCPIINHGTTCTCD